MQTAIEFNFANERLNEGAFVHRTTSFTAFSSNLVSRICFI